MEIVTDPAALDPWLDAVDAPADVRTLVRTELSAPTRAWHGLTHHVLMLRAIDRATTGVDERRRLVWAVLFHDLVYDARAADNEERSADLARAWVPAADRERVAALILATKRHDLSAADPVTRVLLRADLEVLWTAEAGLYAFYARGIRCEYAHVPADAYRKGRAAVLDYLAKALSDALAENEAASLARNLAWEKAQLEAGALDDRPEEPLTPPPSSSRT